MCQAKDKIAESQAPDDWRYPSPRNGIWVRWDFWGQTLTVQ